MPSPTSTLSFAEATATTIAMESLLRGFAGEYVSAGPTGEGRLAIRPDLTYTFARVEPSGAEHRRDGQLVTVGNSVRSMRMVRVPPPCYQCCGASGATLWRPTPWAVSAPRIPASRGPRARATSTCAMGLVTACGRRARRCSMGRRYALPGEGDAGRDVRRQGRQSQRGSNGCFRRKANVQRLPECRRTTDGRSPSSKWHDLGRIP